MNNPQSNRMNTRNPAHTIQALIRRIVPATLTLWIVFPLAVPAQGRGLIRAAASSESHHMESADKAVDGNWISQWKAKGEGVGAWWQVSFPGPTRIGAIILINGATVPDTITSVRIDFSDGSSIDYMLPISPDYPGPDQPGVIATKDNPFDRNTILNAMPTAIGLKDEHSPKSGPHWLRFEARETSFIKITVTGMVNERQTASLAEVRWIEVPEQDEQPTVPLSLKPESSLNLAYVGNGAAQATATSALGEGHRASFLNDGNYGNASAWIGGAPQAAATIDLGRTATVGQFLFGRDRSGQYTDRTIRSLILEIADEGGTWRKVFENANLHDVPGYAGNKTTVIDIEPVRARQVRVTIDPAQTGLDELEIYPPMADESTALPRVAMHEDTGVDPRVYYTGYGLTTGRPDEPWIMSNDEFEVVVDPDTGGITRWTSLEPEPVDLVSADGEMTVYVRNLDRGWEEPFDQLHAWYRGSGVEGGQTYDELTCIVFPRSRNVAYARLNYRMYEDRFEMQAQFTSMVDDWTRYVFGVASELDRAQWPEHRDSAGYMPTDTPYVRSYHHAYDICWEQGDWSTLVYPMGVYRRADRLLMYGSFDLDNHLAFAPNIPKENAHPSVLVSPLGLKAGQTFTFDLFSKTFPRATSGWMEALRWYTRRTYSYDPDFEGIPLRLTRGEPAHLDPGIVAFMPILAATEETEAIREWKRDCIAQGLNNVLYGGWEVWVSAPSNFDIDSEWGELSARNVRDEIAGLRADGFNVFLYMNNFKAPHWVEDLRYIDPNDDREREWYLNRAKAMIHILRPSGIMWDTGWWPPMYAADNRGFAADPRGSSVMGWVKIQAHMRHWMKEHYPDMKVIVNNMAGGSPSVFFADATMVEDSGDAIQEVITEDTRALFLAPFNYNSIFYYDILPRILEGYGQSVAEVKEARALDPKIEDEVWAKWSDRALHALGRGLPIHLDSSSLARNFDVHGHAFPVERSWKIPEVAAFSALANGTPHMAYTHVLTTDVPETFGAVWSNSDRLLASLYNGSDKRQTITARIDRKILGDLEPRRWTPQQSWILSSEAFALPGRTADITITDDAVLFTSELEPGGAALIQIGE